MIALLDREYTPDQALEYQQVDAQERAIVNVQFISMPEIS